MGSKMKIGDYEITALETGRFALDGGAMFGVVPKVIWNKKNPADELNRIDLALRVLLLEGNGRRILIDTGIGHKLPDKYAKIYGIDHELYSLEGALKSKGLTPDDISDVILTHLHFDHAGGATRFEGDAIVPSFKNAQYYIQQANLDWAQNPTEKDKASYLPENFEPLMASGQLKTIQGAGEILPFIHAWTTDGHTIGQQLILIKDDTQALLYAADIIPTATHLAVPYVMGYDLQPLLTIAEKKKILRQAVDQNWVIVFEHDPNMAACTVQDSPKGIVFKEAIEL